MTRRSHLGLIITYCTNPLQGRDNEIPAKRVSTMCDNGFKYRLQQKLPAALVEQGKLRLGRHPDALSDPAGSTTSTSLL